MNKKLVCFILGGGAGSRLYPLTKDRSKPAVPIGGKYRLIDIPLSNCLNSGVRKIFVLTQYNAASLNRHIKNNYNFDVFSRGFIEILAAEQTVHNSDWYKGTADAVRQSLHYLFKHDVEHVLILSGDQLYQMDYNKLIQQHVDDNAELTLATKAVLAKGAINFGVMKVKSNSQVAEFIEKPNVNQLSEWRSEVDRHHKRKGKHFLASMGIYVFNLKALQQLFYENPKANDFGKDIIPYAIKNGYQVFSHQFNNYWADIGTVRSFYEANLNLTDLTTDYNFFKNRKIYTQANMLPPSQITGTRIIHSIIGEGSIIQAKKIQRSIIGLRSRIGKKTKVVRSVIFGNDYIQTLDDLQNKQSNIPFGIGENCMIANTIIDKNSRIGNKVSIQGHKSLTNEDHENYSIIDGIVVIKKGAIIPDGTSIGMKKELLYPSKPINSLEQMV